MDATLATASEDGEVKLWDMPSRHERVGARGALRHGHVPGVFAARRPSRHGQPRHDCEALGDDTGRERASLTGHTDGVSALAFAPSGRQMATGGFDGTVRLWEPATPIFSPAACLAYPGEARSLEFSPDGRSLRAAGRRRHWPAGTP